jgi:hypothetical protein
LTIPADARSAQIHIPDWTNIERHNKYEAMEKTVSLHRTISKRAGMASAYRDKHCIARAEEYREIAEAIRELARRSRFREIKEELYDWAYRCDRTADNLRS